MTNKDIISVLYLSLPTENLVDIEEFKHIHNDSFNNLDCDIKIKYNIVELANNRISLKDVSVETLAVCIMYRINIFKADIIDENEQFTAISKKELV